MDLQQQGEDSYDFIHVADGMFAPIYDVIAEDVLAETGITEGVLLDIGCGGGHLGRAILRRTRQSGIFLDINAQAIRFAEERAQWDQLTDRCTFCCGDVHHMPIPDGSVHLVVSRGSMHLWDDIEGAFREIWRVMAPGAKTYIGGGLGNAELTASIEKQMEQAGMRRGGKGSEHHSRYPTEMLCAMFARLGYSYRYQDTYEKGRWFILSK